MSCKVFIEASLLFVPSRSCIVSTISILQALTPHVTKSLTVGNAAVTTSHRSSSMFRTAKEGEEHSKFWLLTSNCCLELVNIFGQFSPGTLRFTRELFLVWTNPSDEGDLLDGIDESLATREKLALLAKQREMISAINAIPQLCPFVRILKLHMNTSSYFGISPRWFLTSSSSSSSVLNKPKRTAVSFLLPPPPAATETNSCDAQTSSYVFNSNFFFTGFPYLQEFADADVGLLVSENYCEGIVAMCEVARKNLQVLEMSCFSSIFHGMNPQIINSFFSRIVNACPNLEKITMPNYNSCARKTIFEVENSIIANFARKLTKLQQFPGFHGELKESVAMEFATNCGESLTHFHLFGSTFQIVPDDWDFNNNTPQNQNQPQQNDEEEFQQQNGSNNTQLLFSEFFETLMKNARNLKRLNFPTCCTARDFSKFSQILSTPPPIAAFFKKTEVRNPLCYTLQTLSFSNISDPAVTESDHYAPILRNLENLKYLLVTRCPGFTGAESFKEFKNPNKTLVCVYLTALENFDIDEAIYHIGMNDSDSLEECFIDPFSTALSPKTMTEKELTERKQRGNMFTILRKKSGFESWSSSTATTLSEHKMKKLRTLELGEAGWRDQDFVELGKAFCSNSSSSSLESLSVTVCDPQKISDRGLSALAPIILSLRRFTLSGPLSASGICKNEDYYHKDEKELLENAVTGGFLKKWADYFIASTQHRQDSPSSPKLEQLSISTNIGFFTDFTSQEFFEGLEFFGSRSLKRLELEDDLWSGNIMNNNNNNNTSCELLELLSKRNFFVQSRSISKKKISGTRIRPTPLPHLILFSTSVMVSLLLKMTKLKYVKIPFVSEKFATDSIDEDAELRNGLLFVEEFKTLNSGIRKITKEEALTLIEQLNLHDASFLLKKDAVEGDFVKMNIVSQPGRIMLKN